jgi:hypothetical protein
LPSPNHSSAFPADAAPATSRRKSSRRSEPSGRRGAILAP